MPLNFNVADVNLKLDFGGDEISVQDKFIDSLADHEGLLPFQTPARFEAKDTYLGYPIKKDYTKPKGREAFIFLENQEDVKPSIKKQFQTYAKL